MIRGLLGSIHDFLAFCCNGLFVVFISCYGIQYINTIEHTVRNRLYHGDILMISDDKLTKWNFSN